jgi:trehalose/maltose hydrolase-like predicted phosphorylase
VRVFHYPRTYRNIRANYHEQIGPEDLNSMAVRPDHLTRRKACTTGCDRAARPTVIDVTKTKLIRFLLNDQPSKVHYGELRAKERSLDFRFGLRECQVAWMSLVGWGMRVRSARRQHASRQRGPAKGPWTLAHPAQEIDDEQKQVHPNVGEK